MDATSFYADEARYRASMKRPQTLDLDAKASCKKPRATSLLTSPDLNMLKLGSPELEKLIIAQHSNMVAQNQPPASSNPNCMYPKGEEYRDFAEALTSLSHQQNFYSDMGCNAMLPPPPTTNSNLQLDTYGYPQQQQNQPPMANLQCNPMMSAYSTNAGYPYPQQQPLQDQQHLPMVPVKEEPQTVPCMGGGGGSSLSPPLSPIDMEDQERLKLERKRLRNRIAASKCRRRKLERIARLEDKVSLLKSENAELSGHVTRLREHVCQLKQQVLDHVRSGCDMVHVAARFQHEL